jgi:hypothetical protein
VAVRRKRQILISRRSQCERFSQRHVQWASGAGVLAFYFESFDEPPKGRRHRGIPITELGFELANLNRG